MPARSSSLFLAALLIGSAASAQLAWRRVTSSGPRQSLAGYAYDSGRDRLVVFGGQSGTTRFDTTWEYDGTRWQQLNPTTRPSRRSRPSMTYDPIRKLVILFGGRSSTGSFLNDTWSWDGSQWRALSPATRPQARSSAAMTFDAARGVALMFGGFVASGRDASDLWQWDGSKWRMLATGGPRARGATRLAYDRVRKNVLMHGGYSTPLGGTLSDTWTWNGSRWTAITSISGPGSLCDPAFDYDSARNRITLFGGLRINGAIRGELSATWDFDGSKWVARTITPSPGARSFGHASYDSKRRRFLMHGGSSGMSVLNDTWELVPTRPASVTPYGTGCAGSAGVPRLAPAPDQLPWLGDRFDLVVSGAASASSAGLLLFGASDSSWGPIRLPFGMAPLGASGCSVLVSIDMFDVIPLANGSGRIPAAMCNCPALVGIPLYMQIGVIDAAVSRSLKLAMTNGVRIVAGSR